MDVKEVILKDCKLPSMPHIAMRVLQIVNDPMAKVEDLQRTIMADTALSARVLKIANSAYFGLPRMVQTLSDAILLMGFSMVKSIALGMAMKEVLSGAGLLEMKLWEHALGVSLASAMVASRLNRPPEVIEQALIGGLLHDIGKAVLNNSYPEKYLLVFETVIEEKRPAHEVEKEVFGFDHQTVGEVLFDQWNMPEKLKEIVANHHRCHVFDAKPKDFDLCKIVMFSDTLCLYLGIGYRGPQFHYRDDLEAEAEAIGIEFVSFLEEFKERYVLEKTRFMEN